MINPYGASQPGAARAVGLGAPQTGNSSADARFRNSQIAAKNSNLSSAAQIPVPQNRAKPSSKVSQVVSNTPSQGPMGYSQGMAVPNLPGGQVGMVNQGSAPLGDIQSEDLALEYFLSTPEVQEALAKEKLKQYFKRSNPEGAEATVVRDVIQSVVSRVS